MVSITLTLIVIPVVYLIYYLYSLYTYWGRRGIPHERPFPLVGNLRGVGSKYHFRDVNLRIYKRFKGTTRYTGMYLFFTKAAFILDLELIKNVLIKDFSNFHDRGIFNNVHDDPLTGHLVTLEGEQWRAMRNKLSPVFTSGKMKFMFSTIVLVGESLLRAIEIELNKQQSVVMEMKELCARYTTDVIGLCAFGLECNSLHNPDEEFRLRGRQIFEKPRHNQLVQAFMFTNPAWARRLHLKLLRDDVSAFFMDAIRSTVDYRIKNNVKRNDFMDLLIELKAQDEELAKQGGGIDLSHGLTLEQLAAQAFVFFVAGFDTSSTTMSFCLYELALDQQVQDKLRAEIKEVLKRHENQLCYEAMTEMHYLDMVIAETLRKYPVLPHILRTTIADYRVPDSTHIIEKGTTIIIPVDAIHHDAELYPNPEQFDPNRFTQEQVQQRHNCAYLPFGDGPRNCIGLRFGKMQTKIGLISLLRNFKVSPSPLTENPVELDKRNFLIAAKNGLHLTIERVGL